MRIGLMTGSTGGAPSVDSIVADAKQAEVEGFATFAMANIFTHDAIIALTMAGAATERIELMTAVVPTYPRHPFALAQQARTAQAVSGGRFSLGIGLSHQVVIEGMLGMSFEKPALHMREYLAVLMPLLRGEASQYKGEQYTGFGELDIPDATAVPCLLAALGPSMLKLTAELADGTILWMSGPKTVEDYVGPRLREAAAAVGRPEPRIVCALPVMLTSDAESAHAAAAEQFANYNNLPSYRGMLDREGAEGPADVAILGSEEEVERKLSHFSDVGVTDLGVAVFGDAEERARTRAFMSSLAPEI